MAKVAALPTVLVMPNDLATSVDATPTKIPSASMIPFIMNTSGAG
jgi:hypothetical protein